MTRRPSYGVTAAVERILWRYVDGTLDAEAVRRLLSAARPAPNDPAAPIVVIALNILSHPSSESQRRERLAALMDQQPGD